MPQPVFRQQRLDSDESEAFVARGHHGRQGASIEGRHRRLRQPTVPPYPATDAERTRHRVQTVAIRAVADDVGRHGVGQLGKQLNAVGHALLFVESANCKESRCSWPSAWREERGVHWHGGDTNLETGSEPSAVLASQELTAINRADRRATNRNSAGATTLWAAKRTSLPCMVTTTGALPRASAAPMPHGNHQCA